MRKLFLLSLTLSLYVVCLAQPGDNKRLRAFPITNYVVDLSDTIKLVQVYLEDPTLVKEKQMGVLRGAYNASRRDTLDIGGGRCQLIKGEYYYFSIDTRKSGITPKENDLLYTSVERTTAYDGKFIKLAAHYIELQNVYETALYDRHGIFKIWTAADEHRTLDSIVADIHFTGDYFSKNNPSMNEAIRNGKYKDQKVLNVMTTCSIDDVNDFLDYMIARPRLYAGHKWKISEIFATWLTSGAPTVIK
jgi:hypothetical protein